MDWLKSNIEFKENSLQQMKNRIDLVTMNTTRSNAVKELVEEARISASKKEGMYFTVLDDELMNGYSV